MKQKIQTYKIFLSTILFLSFSTIAQNKWTYVEHPDLPKEIDFKGNFRYAFRWADTLGDNIVITSENGPVFSNYSDQQYFWSYLYASHFIKNKNGIFKKTLYISDSMECEKHSGLPELGFVYNTFKTTDLNKDGSNETWLVYKKRCGKDSISDLTIVMTEGRRKFFMKGKIKVADSQYNEREYSFDKQFKKLPDTYKNFAKLIWTENSK